MNDHDDINNLLLKFLEEDSGAAAIIYALYAETFYLEAKRRGLSDQDAEDAIIITFQKVTVAVAKRNYDATKGSGSAWLKSIFINTVRDIQRRKVPDARTGDSIESALDAEACEFDDPVKYILYQEKREYIQLAFRLLPEADRRAILEEFLRDRQEILEGRRRKRGPAPAAYRNAQARWRALFHQIYEGTG